MRNLKKFLALVLAMMMTLSLMITVNAASDFTDVDTITDEFSEGVAVLKGLGVFEGYPDGSFKPKDNITRAEVATIVYRLATSDVDGVQAHLYKDYATFSDVKSDHWAAGYINYCANAEWIAGYGNGKFGPNDSVTGYQAAAMILRAVGYGKNNEFKGSGWQVQVANVTRSEGLLVNVDNTTYANTLNQPATRELIAEILFQAGLIDTVDWTMLLGYRPTGKGSLAQINFNLHVTTIGVVDDWGNPGYYWIKGTALKSNLSNVVATIGFEPNMTFTDVKRECDIAHEMKISTSKNFVLYVNDGAPLTKNYLVVATDTVTKVGGQGRLTKVYGDLSHPHIANNTWPASVTMVDTFLAQVTGVSNAVVDAAGHVIIPAKLTVSIYDRAQTTDKVANPSANRIISKSSTDATNWEYSKGDMVLLNAYTDHDFSTSKHATDSATDALTGTAAHTNIEQAAYQSERVAVKDYDALDEDATYTNVKQVNDVEYAEVLGVAKSTVAKQTVVYWNSEKHDVGGTEYPDQLDLFLDVAGTTTNSDFTWYFDQYNNVIGIGEAIKSNYGVITSIYSSFSTGDGATDGKAVAKAHVKYSDGTEADVIIDRFLASNEGDNTKGHQAAGTKLDGANSTAANRNVVELLPLYDYAATGDVMTGVVIPTGRGYTSPSNVETSYDLLVSPVASINKAAELPQKGVDDGTGTASTNAKHFGIIEQNLFKFVTSGDGKLTAIEVAGAFDPSDPSNENTDIYAGHYNALDTANASEWKKNLGFVTVNSKTIRLDNNTQIMLKEGTKINTYKGLSELPGDVTIAKLTEVDWADYNGDGIADVLYTTATVKGNITHGLFYYTNGAAQWNGADKKGTLAGYLNGEATTLTFGNEKLFNLVKNGSYTGHIFAVEITNGEVTNLFGKAGTTANTGTFAERFAGSALALNNDNNAGLMKNKTALGSIALTDGISTDTYSKTGAVFVTGAAGGNSYTKNTQVVAAQVTGAAGTYANGIVTVGGAPYYLTGVSKTLGNDLSYLNLAGRKSDVTIVFEDAALDTIVEIYVTTEPDDTTTPVGTTVTFGSDITKAPTGFANGNDLKAWLKGFSGGVFYCTDQKTGTTNATEATMLYFPFVSPTATGSAVLEIRNASGTLVYSEANNLTGAGALLYSFDFANATGSWMISPNGLTAGTYSYNITVNGTSVSSGTFTLVLK